MSFCSFWKCQPFSKQKEMPGAEHLKPTGTCCVLCHPNCSPEISAVRQWLKLLVRKHWLSSVPLLCIPQHSLPWFKVKHQIWGPLKANPSPPAGVAKQGRWEVCRIPSAQALYTLHHIQASPGISKSFLSNASVRIKLHIKQGQGLEC